LTAAVTVRHYSIECNGDFTVEVSGFISFLWFPPVLRSIEFSLQLHGYVPRVALLNLPYFFVKIVQFVQPAKLVC
jgi:hypothetical protein